MANRRLNMDPRDVGFDFSESTFAGEWPKNIFDSDQNSFFKFEVIEDDE